jgi:metal-responsive CopG/Arc/MetJ family transcriptional regulator
MKVAVSLPDPVFKAAETLARRLKKSRSRIYAEALASYVSSHDAMAVREKLDAVYAVQDSRLDKVLTQVQLRSLKDEAW